MGSRLELQSLLEDIFVSLGMTNTSAHSRVYFQPPETVKMTYPCIVYTLDRIDTRYANDKPYLHDRAYTITIIDKNPDSEIPDRVSELPMCSFTRKFTNDNLNHFVFRLYY